MYVGLIVIVDIEVDDDQYTADVDEPDAGNDDDTDVIVIDDAPQQSRRQSLDRCAALSTTNKRQASGSSRVTGTRRKPDTDPDAMDDDYHPHKFRGEIRRESPVPSVTSDPLPLRRRRPCLCGCLCACIGTRISVSVSSSFSTFSISFDISSNFRTTASNPRVDAERRCN